MVVLKTYVLCTTTYFLIGEPNNWGSKTEDCIMFGYNLWNKLINNNDEYDEGKFCDVTCSAIFNHHVCSSPPPSRVRSIYTVIISTDTKTFANIFH